jgi:hypothetical protein
MNNLGKYLVVAGALIMVLGIVIWLFGNKLHWFGNLPGDVKIDGKNFKVFAPLTSMLLLSIFLSLLIWAVNKFFR